MVGRFRQSPSTLPDGSPNITAKQQLRKRHPNGFAVIGQGIMSECPDRQDQLARVGIVSIKPMEMAQYYNMLCHLSVHHAQWRTGS
jgi:hypothetical protein